MIENLAKQSNYSSFKDWYNFQSQFIQKNGGKEIIKKYGNIYFAFKELFPEYQWSLLYFSRLPNHFFHTKELLRDYMNDLFIELNLKSKGDWYKVNAKTLLNYCGGATLLQKYNWNILKILKDISQTNEQTDEWDELYKKKKSIGYLDSPINQRKIIEEVGKKLKIKSVEEWFSISTLTFRNNGGGTVLKRHNGSLIRALKFAYPELNWPVENFYHLPQSHWNNHFNLVNLAKSLQKDYKIKKMEDWYRISSQQMMKFRGKMEYQGGIYYLLSQVYPQYQWDKKFFSIRAKRSAQRDLFRYISSLFNDKYQIIENYKHSMLSFRSGSFCEIDVFIPELNMGFEYNGEHHYDDHPAFGLIDLYIKRDIDKEFLCKKLGIPLIVVPYWFSRSENGLINFLTSCIKLELCKEFAQ